MQCANALAPYLQDPDAIAAVFGHTIDVVEVLEIEHGWYLTFEWIGRQDYLGEHIGQDRTRGSRTTSADAAIPHRTPNGDVEIALIEWKYTEDYTARELSGGLFRRYWIPPGAEASSGAYVRYPAHELLDILALEAARAGAFVVGEDLGTVEDEVREEMQARNLLSNRLLLFEPRPATEFPEQALAAIRTHDLPTLTDLWTGFDLAEQRKILPTPNEQGDDWFRSRVSKATGRGPDAPVNDVIVAAAEALAQAPSQLVVGTLDDARAVPERPNLPGTIDEWPNWRLALPLMRDEIEADPLAQRVASALSHPKNPEWEVVRKSDGCYIRTA